MNREEKKEKAYRSREWRVERERGEREKK